MVLDYKLITSKNLRHLEEAVKQFMDINNVDPGTWWEPAGIPLFDEHNYTQTLFQIRRR